MIDWLQVFFKAEKLKDFRKGEGDRMSQDDVSIRQLKVGSFIVDIEAHVRPNVLRLAADLPVFYKYTIGETEKLDNTQPEFYAYLSFIGKYQGTRKKYVTTVTFPIPINSNTMFPVGESWYTLPEFDASFVKETNYTDAELTLLRLA